MSSIGATMTMRCTIERDANAGIAEERDWRRHLLDVPCYWWAMTANEQDAAARTVLIEDHRAVVALDVDVSVTDRIAEIDDRLGRVLRDAPLEVKGVIPRPDHQELILRTVSP